MLVQGWHRLMAYQSPLPNRLQPLPDLSETLPNTFILTKPLFRAVFLCYNKYLRRGKYGTYSRTIIYY